MDDPKLHKLVGDLADAKATVFDITPASMIALLKAIAAGSPTAALSQAQTDAQARATPQPTKEAKSATGTSTQPAASATAISLMASNANRLGGSITNDSTSILYVLYGTGTVSATVYSIKMQPDDYLEVPYGFTGVLTGIWVSATGNARVTELT